MSYAIGARIKELRLERKISQEEIADILETTRQRIARIESGQIDISYDLLKRVADYFGISINEITKVAEERKGLTAMFREKSDSPMAIAAIEKIEEILKVFHAHEKLYYQMKERDYCYD